MMKKLITIIQILTFVRKIIAVGPNNTYHGVKNIS